MKEVLLTPKDQVVLFRVLLVNYFLLCLELISVSLYMTVLESVYLLIPALTCLVVTIMLWLLYLQRLYLNRKQSVHPKLKHLSLRFNRSPHSNLHFGLIILLESALVTWLFNLMFSFMDSTWLFFVILASITLVMIVIMISQHLTSNQRFKKSELY